MIKPIKNSLFSIATVGVLAASIINSGTIIENIKRAERMLPTPSLEIIMTTLFINVCLMVFALLILGNLNDYILYRIVNLIGAYQKLRVVGEKALI